MVSRVSLLQGRPARCVARAGRDATKTEGEPQAARRAAQRRDVSDAVAAAVKFRPLLGRPPLAQPRELMVPVASRAIVRV
jgi:hypothetical protein